jgi:hypothetical protein
VWCHRKSPGNMSSNNVQENTSSSILDDDRLSPSRFGGCRQHLADGISQHRCHLPSSRLPASRQINLARTHLSRIIFQQRFAYRSFREGNWGIPCQNLVPSSGSKTDVSVQSQNDILMGQIEHCGDLLCLVRQPDLLTISADGPADTSDALPFSTSPATPVLHCL